MSTESAAFLLVPLIFFISITLALLTKNIKNFLKHRSVIVAQYDAPDGLGPAEVGFLLDGSFGPNELLAGIIGMYQTKKLVISVSKNGLRATLPARRPKNLDDYEAAIYTFVENKKGSYDLKLVNTFGDEYAGLQADLSQLVTQSLTAKGFIDRSRRLKIDDDNRSLILKFSFIESALFIGLLFSSSIILLTAPGSPGDGFAKIDAGASKFVLLTGVLVGWPFFYGISLLAFSLFYHLAGIPLGSTYQLRETWPQVEGYKDFIKTVEYERLRTDNNIMDASYPWCLALGLDPGLAEALIKHS